MALETQMLDVPLTAGVDTKTTPNTTIDRRFTAITNMRTDFVGGYIPRVGFTLGTGFTTSTPSWMVSSSTKTIYSTASRTVTGVNSTNLISAPGTLKRIAFGSQLDADPAFIASATQSLGVLTAWYYAASTAGPQISFQWYNISSGDTTGGSISADLPEIQVTSGPSSYGFLWGISAAGALSCYRMLTNSGSSEALTVSNGGITITRFDVVYDSGSAGWYMIYVEGANTKLVKYTISGTTVTAGTPVTITGAASANVAISMIDVSATTRIGLAYYVTATTTLGAALYSTALSSVSSNAVVGPTGISNLGVTDSRANTMYVTATKYTNSVLPGVYGYTLDASSTFSNFASANTFLGAITGPVAIETYSGSGTYYPYVAGVDMLNVSTYGAAGLGYMSNAGLQLSYRWSSNAAVGLNMHRGARITRVGTKYYIPQIWEGRVEELATPSSTGFGTVATQQVAGIVLIDETVSCAPTYQRYGTSEIIAAGSLYGVDSISVGPAGAFPIPAIQASTIVVSNGAGTLTSSSTYSYRLLKRWSDSLGNIQECVSPPFIAVLGGTDDTVDFTIPAQAFQLAQQAPTGSANVQIKVYRTEANGGVHYFVPTRAYFSATAVTDTTPDSGLDLTDALTYDGGELEDKELPHIKHLTTWQGRLVALTSDGDTKAYYSKPQEDFRGARFADGLEIDFPQAKGGLVGLAGMDYTLFAFTQNEVYTLSGQPAGATGQDGSLGSPELRFQGLGCSSTKSILVTPKGVVFQSGKGVYIILRNQELDFIGEGPFSDRTTTIVGAYVDADRPEFHYTLSTGTEWVYNWDQGIWTSFTLPATPLCTSLQGTTPKFLATDGIWAADSESSEVIPLTMTTAWISLTGIQGYQRCRNIMLLLEYLAAHTLSISAYTDFDDTTAVQTWSINTATDVSTTDPYQIRLHLKDQKCEAIKLKITSTTAGWNISGITMEIGIKKDHYKTRKTANTF